MSRKHGGSKVALVVTSLLVAGCGREATMPTQPDVPAVLAPGNKVDTDSRANLVWADNVLVGGSMVPAGIQGDSRDKFGNPAGLPSDEYQAKHCGVAAIIYNGSNETGALKVSLPDSVGYPAQLLSACGAPKAVRFYLGGPGMPPTVPGHDMVFFVDQIWQLGAGQSRLQAQGFWVEQPGCQQLKFDALFPPSSNVRVTRLADIGTVRQWRVESQGNHTAICVNTDKRGRAVPSTTTYVLPFAFVVTEVPYPAWLSGYP